MKDACLGKWKISSKISISCKRNMLRYCQMETLRNHQKVPKDILEKDSKSTAMSFSPLNRINKFIQLSKASNIKLPRHQ